MKLGKSIALTTALLLLLPACSIFSDIYQPPKPWERDKLAQEKMLIGGDPLDAAIDDHIYFSKEATSIGSSIGGGGCGCN